jgi:peroxiredoxin/predicted 2-oxoglutarate/Fe(II)-dependent dioxygenase YbiX
MLLPGDPAPDFTVASSVNPKYHFDTTAGQYIVLSFFGSAASPYAQQLLKLVDGRRDRFDVTHAIFFGVSIDPQDSSRLTQEWPGMIYFWDADLAVSRLYGVVSEQGAADGKTVFEARTFILDQAMRVVAIVPFSVEPADHLKEILRMLDDLPAVENLMTPAPVLVVPYVFESEFCHTLIDYYQKNGGDDSGFMRDVGGKTVGLVDYSHKRRMDCEIRDEALVKAAQQRLSRRVIPAIKQAFQFNATRIERHIVACYDAADGGHFRAHRDNTTLGTAHRRFAITMNLNAEEYEGGDLWFPEFGRRAYRASTGGAVVFSCSLLHEAAPVSKGRRYAFLPFLYDDAAAQVRERNRQYLSDEVVRK